jgi:hypothetical protein
MASGKTYRQKGDLRALNVLAESTYNVPGSTATYMGTLDTMTPKDSETVTWVPDDGSRGKGTPYRTAVDMGFDARFSFAGGSGWTGWLALALGGGNNATVSGSSSYQPTSFSAWFKTSGTEEQIYTGAVVDVLTISASE